MKKSVLFLATVLFSAFAHAALPIEGSWGAKYSQGPLSFDITFTFTSDSLILTNVCSMGGRSATAQVTTSAFYTESSITTNQLVHDEESSGGVNCNVSSQPGTINYSVQGNTLILSAPGNPQMVLNRR